ncbi:putative pathogenesis associated protein Cap20 [Thermoascus aurantiacus ATCC 26904]
MPHAEKDTMGEPAVNGEKVHSQFLTHLASYPVISESIATFKNTKYGAKSLDYADQSYSRFAKPVLPYLSKPYGYLAPYIAKVDALGDSGLSKVELAFPIVKEDTETIKGTIRDRAYLPLRLAGDVKKHVFELYDSEYAKCGGNGYVASGKAVITTGLLLSQESLAWLSTFLGSKKEEQAKDAVNEKANN